MTDHPITPPPELLDKWDNLPLSTQEIFVIAARWGADQELEACCHEVQGMYGGGSWLRAARRPKPSLKEEALKGFYTIAGIVLDEYYGTKFYEEYKKVADTVLRALEQLDD